MEKRYVLPVAVFTILVLKAGPKTWERRKLLPGSAAS
jgi:hypothetical protein